MGIGAAVCCREIFQGRRGHLWATFNGQIFLMVGLELQNIDGLAKLVVLLMILIPLKIFKVHCEWFRSRHEIFCFKFTKFYDI